MHRFTPPTPVDSTHRTAITVVLEAWEIQCCAAPPVVGEETSFTLSFHTDRGGGDVPGLVRSYSWTVHPLRLAHDTDPAASRLDSSATRMVTGPAVVSWAGVSAYWPQAPVGAGAVTADGYLVGNRHGGVVPQDVPTVTGEVTRVQVLRRVLVETEPRRLQPVPGSIRLRDVQRGPRRFEREVVPGAVPHRVIEEDALVIDLRVPGTAILEDLV